MRCYTMQTASSRRSRALRLSMLRWSLNARCSAPRAAAMARLGRDPSAKTRDRMMEYVGEAMDD